MVKICWHLTLRVVILFNYVSLNSSNIILVSCLIMLVMIYPFYHLRYGNNTLKYIVFNDWKLLIIAINNESHILFNVSHFIIFDNFQSSIKYMLKRMWLTLFFITFIQQRSYTYETKINNCIFIYNFVCMFFFFFLPWNNFLMPIFTH